MVRGLAMIESLRKNFSNFEVWVLCLSDECKTVVDKLKKKEIRSVSLSSLESANPNLLEAKKNRSKVEYYFTLSPFWPSWILENFNDISGITYLDADLEFFSSPQVLFDRLENYSIGIIDHRFHSLYDHSRYAGRFNVGFVYFKNDEIGNSCLKKWKFQCLECCEDQSQGGKFADQMYLDSWPENYENLLILDHPGANLAPWNINSHHLNWNEGKLYSDKHKVIFYHFHMLRKYDDFHLSTSLEIYNVPVEVRREKIKQIYISYLNNLKEIESSLNEIGFKFNAFESLRDYSIVDKAQDSNKNLLERINAVELIRYAGGKVIYYS